VLGISADIFTLVEKLPKQIELVRILGGLAPDSDEPMPDETRDYVIRNWQQIQKDIPDTRFNYDFWKHCQPRRSTYPACRAVLAAKKQGIQYDEAMTYSIQRAYYLEARNPSDNKTLIELANEVGLNRTQFRQDLISDEINQQLFNELKIARKLQLNSFPGFILTSDTQSMHIQPDYHHASQILNKIHNVV